MFDTANGLPFESIAALHPDLIPAGDDYTLTQDYATLAKIAPTLSYQTGVGADTWQTMTARAGRVLGQAGKAAALVAATGAKIATAKQRNTTPAGKTFTFGPVSDPNSVFTINCTDDARGSATRCSSRRRWWAPS